MAIYGKIKAIFLKRKRRFIPYHSQIKNSFIKFKKKSLRINQSFIAQKNKAYDGLKMKSGETTKGKKK